MTVCSTEIWKDIPGYEGKYQASNLGRIRSVDHRVRLVAHGTETTRLVRGRVLKPGRYTKTGHVSVVLGHGKNGSPVHQLIALTFLGPRPDRADICHNDGDPTNNAVDNLRYDTRDENIKDVMREGRAWRKLTISQVQDIRDRIANGDAYKAIARDYGVSICTIGHIKQRRTYAWLK